MTIVYVLLVLRAVRGEAAPEEVPETAVAMGTALALVSVIALLAFVQSVARLMVADEVVLRVRRELDSAINRLPPRERGGSAPAAKLPDDFEDKAARIRLPREGYVQSVEFSGLARWAQEHDAVLRLDFRPGDFVVEGDHKVLIAPAPADPERARSQIEKFIVSGSDRTPTQDLEFAVRHLVEVAVRALSPGINDPFTAMAVVDRLRGALARLASMHLPECELHDGTGRLRVVRKVSSYAGVTDAALNQIRQAAESKPSVLVHMARAIGAIAEHTQTDEQRAVLRQHAELVRAAAEREVRDPLDLGDVNQAVNEALNALAAAASEPRPS